MTVVANRAAAPAGSPGTAGWQLGPRQPYRVNLRYSPDRAVLRVVGVLTAAGRSEVEHQLDVLGDLPAPLTVAVSQESAADVIEMLARPRAWPGGSPVVVAAATF